MTRRRKRRAYLVTGAAGFIGSHVAEALVKRGDHVLGVDNLDGYYAPSRKRLNLTEARAAARDGGELSFFEVDIRDEAEMRAVVEGQRVDAVLHLAAMPGVRASIARPRQYFDVNVTGTLCLLELAVESGIERFVQASSSAVYGESAHLPFCESESCGLPTSPYAASKRACELMGHVWHRIHGLSYTALRYFSVYGPRGRPDMMPYKLLDNIFSGRPVSIFDAGKTTRDWTHVDDVVAATVAAADAPLDYSVINVGRGEAVPLERLVELLEELGGGTTKLDAAPRPEADLRHTQADISVARRLLGYWPRVSLAEGMRGFVAWYKGRRPSFD